MRTTRQPLPNELKEIPVERRVNRQTRQREGELAGIQTLQSFLDQRGKDYSAGISSPASAWTSWSCLSVYLSWGHLSVRHLHQATKRSSEALKQLSDTSSFRRSLGPFQARVHWRVHFI